MWACTFGLVGWGMNAVRHWVQWDDPLIVAVWVGGFTFAAGILHPLLLLLADSSLIGRSLPWFPILTAAGVHGAAAYSWFPALRRFVQRSVSSFYL